MSKSEHRFIKGLRLMLSGFDAHVQALIEHVRNLFYSFLKYYLILSTNIYKLSTTISLSRRGEAPLGDWKMDFYTAATIWIFSAVAILALNVVDGLGLVGNAIMDAAILIAAIGFVAYKRMYEKMTDSDTGYIAY